MSDNHEKTAWESPFFSSPLPMTVLVGEECEEKIVQHHLIYSQVCSVFFLLLSVFLLSMICLIIIIVFMSNAL